MIPKYYVLAGNSYSYEDFRSAIGQRESSNRYGITNPYGYMGRYQFGMTTLRSLGYTGTSQQFLNDPYTQDHYFDLLVQSNAAAAINLLPAAKMIDSNYTLSGLVAGAHLKGIGGVRDYINNGNDNTDANGTHISSYISQFSGYDIPGYDETVSSGDPAHQATLINDIIAPFQDILSPVFNVSSAGFNYIVPIVLLLGAAASILIIDNLP